MRYFYDKSANTWNEADDLYEPLESEIEVSRDEFIAWEKEQVKLHKEDLEKRNNVILVKKTFKQNLSDINIKEQQEFLLFYNLFDQGFNPDIQQYPLVLAQIQEWIEKEAMPDIF